MADVAVKNSSEDRVQGVESIDARSSAPNGDATNKDQSGIATIIEGELRRGRLYGKAKVVYANGDQYEGDFRRGMRSGRGVLTMANGTVMSGIWRNDKMHGRGVLTSADGDTIDGDWAEGDVHGHATRTWNGNTFTGDWQRGTMHGFGTLHYANGHTFSGEFRNGDAHGKGTLIFADGDKFEGEWRDSKYHGKGIKTTGASRFDVVYDNGSFVSETPRPSSPPPAAGDADAGASSHTDLTSNAADAPESAGCSSPVCRRRHRLRRRLPIPSLFVKEKPLTE